MMQLRLLTAYCLPTMINAWLRLGSTQTIDLLLLVSNGERSRQRAEYKHSPTQVPFQMHSVTRF